MTVEKELECVTQQDNVNITKEDVSIHLRKIPNWKPPGPDGLHEKILAEKIHFSSPGNGKTSTSLYPSRVLLTGIINGKIYDHLNQPKLLPEEQKGCRRKLEEQRISS